MNPFSTSGAETTKHYCDKGHLPSNRKERSSQSPSRQSKSNKFSVLKVPSFFFSGFYLGYQEISFLINNLISLDKCKGAQP
jgi:hypothetical protein